MNIVLLTQEDPFYLGKNIDYLLRNMPAHSRVVVLRTFRCFSFWERESFLGKAKKTYDIFGVVFFARYAARFVWSKIVRKWQVSSVLARHGVPLIQIQGSINSEQALARIAS